MKSKTEWEKDIQSQGIKAWLDERSVMMLKSSDEEEVKKYREVMKDYPYSWGIKGGSVDDDQREVLSSDQEA